MEVRTEEVSLTDQAYQIIKDNIINMTYAPGSYITEAGLAEELDVSRMPVRTAVKWLQSEGLIIGGYRKKMRVKEITRKDILEIYQLRELLEGGALRLIYAQGKEKQYSYLIEEKMVRMRAVEDDYFRWEEADTQLHAEILGIYDSERIMRIYQNNHDEIMRIGLLSSRSKCDVSSSNKEIERFVRALREGSMEDAEKALLQEHLGNSKARALERIE